MITEGNPLIPRKIDLEKNPSGTELKIERQREIEKNGRYVAIPGDKTHTRIFVKNGKMLPVKLPLTSRELKIDLICGINYEL